MSILHITIKKDKKILTKVKHRVCSIQEAMDFAENYEKNNIAKSFPEPMRWRFNFYSNLIAIREYENNSVLYEIKPY